MRSSSHHIGYLIATLTTVAAFALNCSAQEVASLDLTKVEGRVDLRRPKATTAVIAGYSGTQQITPCLDPAKKMGALQATVVSLDRTHYQLGDEPIFEVKIENTGSTPIRIPFSPHLADLQAEDPGQKFGYSELNITLWIVAGNHWSTNMGGGVTLYGAEGHKRTMVALNSGEWVRIIGKGHLSLDDDLIRLVMQGQPPDQLYAEASLYRSEMLITATQSATVRQEVCIEQTHANSTPIQLTIP